VKFLVYKLTNSINGKCYIGISSRAVDVRWMEHVARMRSGERKSNRLYTALAKYGPENFKIEVIAYAFSEEEVRALETHYIKKFNSYLKGYNCNLGGHGFLHFPEHIKRKISKAQKGKIISAESRAKMSKAKLGDSRCAKKFGVHLNKGAENPRAKSYLVQFPDGTVHVVKGMRAFCREHKLTLCKLTHGTRRTKGYMLLKRFNDHPEREYAQAGGNGGHPIGTQDEDMIWSAG
jgi:group I intron endonuclease